MDDAELTVSNKNEVLSQSYSQGLQRIGCKNTITDFHLPAGLIRMREDQWEEFFKRYDKELGEDLEIDLNTDYDEEEEKKKAEANSVEESDFELRQLDSDAEESEDSDDDDDDDEDDVEEEEEEEEEGEEEQYFEKNRAPLRKTPNLIQYWIDTGRPPILMTEEPEEFRELLSEDNPQPAVGKIVNSTEAEAKRPSNSVFSSVDTAAYILSNTNVTAKAETIAIVEGAKSLDLNDINVNVNPEVSGGLANGIACDIRDKSPKNSSPKKHHRPNKNIKALRIKTPVKENGALIEAPKNLVINNSNINEDYNQNSNTAFKNKDNLKPRLNNNPIAQCSPKIADVLPTHDDPTKAKVIESSNISKEYDNENSLKSLKINWNNNNSKVDFTVSNGRKPLRKKLYTQRNSPITIVPTTPISVHSNFNDSDYFDTDNRINYETESNKILGKLHPIFATPFTKKTKVKRIKRASWARRMSRYSKVNKSSDADETTATTAPDNSVENNSQENDSKSKNSGKKESEDKSAKKKKKLIKAKKIRQSIGPKELINYNEFLSEEERLNKSKENVMEVTEALEEAKSKELDEKKNNEACDLLKVCKKLTINLEPLPDDYLKPKNVINEIQNLEDSLESDGSTILMYECALNNKDGNTDTETGTEVSRYESEDDKSQKSGVETVKKSKKFVQRCLGSLSDKNLTEPSVIGTGNSISTRINDTDDEDDDLELGKVSSFTVQSWDAKPTDKSLKERVISFSSDEEDDFLKILSKNKSQSRISVSKLEASKNYDSLVNDLTTGSKVRLSSLVSTPMAVLKIVSDSEDEQLISQDDLNVKRRSVGMKQEKSPKVRSKRLEMLDKRKGRFSSEGNKIEESVGIPRKIGEFNGLADDNRDNLSLQPDGGKTLQLNGELEAKDLKNTMKKSKLEGKSKKRLSKIAEFDSSDELSSPPKKIKILEGKSEASGDGNSELEPNSSIKLGCKNSDEFSDKNKSLDSSKGVKLKEINCKLKFKEVQSPGKDLQSNFKTPVNKIIKSNFNSNSVKKRVSFSATKLEKILVYDSSDSSDDSVFVSNKSPNADFNKIANNNNNNNNNNNTSSDNVKKSLNKRITFSSSGCSLTNIKVFSSRFVSDSDDSND